MVLISDGVTQNTLRTSKGEWVCVKINLKFAIALDLNKCLDQVKLPISLNTVASISELPSDISPCPETYGTKNEIYLSHFRCDKNTL